MLGDQACCPYPVQTILWPVKWDRRPVGCGQAVEKGQVPRIGMLYYWEEPWGVSSVSANVLSVLGSVDVSDL